ncbi:hypothetical protein AKJ35_00490 [candidate division MSBL1 archaeon SCGC-AAA833F18]|uniref:Toprim domain-containing protein n=2 Tax=candidate division MSBL1 TaxID=215777 RepID=A0A133VRU3_9EURY|nr:hypothetical protein AKJ46_00835 [candidate division MSBL1 archaeon SCGC-AAA833K04]KXB09621.1 hypothetical protein AKJ35_00490 [candidate division MSBL1 archaeon SCGC-AAA833F18]
MLSSEALEEIEKILDEIRQISKEGTPIIVEGEKDEKSLRELDIKGPIYHISGNQKSTLNFLESLRGYEKVVVLTDFDQEGDKLARFSSKHLPKLGVDAELDLRKKLKKYVRKGVKDIEGLSKFFKREKLENSKDNSRVNQNP